MVAYRVAQGVDPAVAIRVFADEARAHAAAGVQRGRDVAQHALGVPAANAAFEPALHFLAVGMLAHQVDRGRRVARAGHQAGGAAHDFHAFVGRQAARDFAGAPGLVVGGGDAVDLQVVDVEAARGEAGAVGFVLVDRDAGDVVDDVGHGGHLLVFDALQVDHGDRLRRLARRQRQRRRAAHDVRVIGSGGWGLLGADLHLLDRLVGSGFIHDFVGLGMRKQRHGHGNRQGNAVQVIAPTCVHMHFHQRPRVISRKKNNGLVLHTGHQSKRNATSSVMRM